MTYLKLLLGSVTGWSHVCKMHWSSILCISCLRSIDNQSLFWDLIAWTQICHDITIQLCTKPSVYIYMGGGAAAAHSFFFRLNTTVIPVLSLWQTASALFTTGPVKSRPIKHHGWLLGKWPASCPPSGPLKFLDTRRPRCLACKVTRFVSMSGSAQFHLWSVRKWVRVIQLVLGVIPAHIGGPVLWILMQGGGSTQPC